MALEYRKATPADAGSLIEFLNAVGGESDNLSFGAEGVSFSAEEEARFIAGISAPDTMLLALEDGKLVGTGSVFGSDKPRFAHRCEAAVSVRKSCWGRGVGSGIMERLIAFAKEQGKTVVALEVRSDNERAKALYRKLGFVKIGTYERFFRIDGEYFGADLMNLYL